VAASARNSRVALSISERIWSSRERKRASPDTSADTCLSVYTECMRICIRQTDAGTYTRHRHRHERKRAWTNTSAANCLSEWGARQAEGLQPRSRRAAFAISQSSYGFSIFFLIISHKQLEYPALCAPGYVIRARILIRNVD